MRFQQEEWLGEKKKKVVKKRYIIGTISPRDNNFLFKPSVTMAAIIYEMMCAC